MEVAVVLTISLILLSTVTINLTETRRRGRDSERKADIEMMAQCLESEYAKKNEYVGTIVDLEKCPKSTDFMTPPDSSAPATVKATNATTTIAGVRPLPTKNTYVFQPLTGTGTLCSSACSSYNLYYYSEKDNSVVKVLGRR